MQLSADVAYRAVQFELPIRTITPFTITIGRGQAREVARVGSVSRVPLRIGTYVTSGLPLVP